MDHVVSPDDVEPIEVIDLEETSTCPAEGCTNVVDDESTLCWDCHDSHCDEHLTKCTVCDDVVCPNCEHHTPGGVVHCSHCIKTITSCVVCETAINSGADDTYYCESHDAHTCSDHYAGDNLCTDCYSSNDGDEEHHSATAGSSHVAPWDERGIHEPNSGYEEADDTFASLDAQSLWGVDSNLSLNQGAADFYLLEVVQHNVDVGEIAEPMLWVMAEEASAYRKNLVDVYDRSFTGYADMAIGGELRYHMAVGGGRHLPGERTDAWKVWKLLRERGGPDLLLDAARLFREIRGASVGGERWADAAKLLHARVTGAISKEQWVDRVFTLQHNGGAFTNKIAWGPDRCESGQDITAIIGPAHDANPPNFRVLRRYASSEARSLFADWWTVANKNRLRWRRTMWIHPTEVNHEHLRQACSWFEVFVTRGWRTESIRAEKLAAWGHDPRGALKRFRPFFASRELAWTHSVDLEWHTVDPRLCRTIVGMTLDPHRACTPQTVHYRLPAYVQWVCAQIVKSYQPQQASAFKVLTDAGILIPFEYLEAAGLPVELEPF